jgi:hypothetical protein
LRRLTRSIGHDAVLGAADRVDIRRHQRLGEAADHLTQQIDVGLFELLAKPGARVHACRGDHRWSSSSSCCGRCFSRMARSSLVFEQPRPVHHLAGHYCPRETLCSRRQGKGPRAAGVGLTPGLVPARVEAGIKPGCSNRSQLLRSALLSVGRLRWLPTRACRREGRGPVGGWQPSRPEQDDNRNPTSRLWCRPPSRWGQLPNVITFPTS